eukprot:5593749-Alexandrium_andersonii.AAC.1
MCYRSPRILFWSPVGHSLQGRRMVHSDRSWRSRSLERRWRSGYGAAPSRHLAPPQRTIGSQTCSRLALRPVALGRGPR